jgi:hypothetical protein
MDITKNIFGQYVARVQDTLTPEEEVIVESLLNTVADGILAQIGDDGFVKETKDIDAVVQHVATYTNKASLPNIDKIVDGTVIRPIVEKIINERLAIIAAKQTGE